MAWPEKPPKHKKALHTAQVSTKQSWVLLSLKQIEPPVKTTPEQKSLTGADTTETKR